MEKECCCTHKTKERGEAEYRSLLNRLSRIEGQIRGIRNMVEESAYCTDILVQVSAVTAALNAFNKELLANHIKTCVAEDIKNGKGQDTPVHLQAPLFKGYKYPHDYPNSYVNQQYLPDDLKGVNYYEYGNNKTEQAAKAYWEAIKGNKN